MNPVTDKFGTPILPGCTIVVALRRGSGAELRKGRVVGFTKTGGCTILSRKWSFETEDSKSTIWPGEMMVVAPPPEPEPEPQSANNSTQGVD